METEGIPAIATIELDLASDQSPSKSLNTTRCKDRSSTNDATTKLELEENIRKLQLLLAKMENDYK